MSIKCAVKVVAFRRAAETHQVLENTESLAVANQEKKTGARESQGLVG